MIQCRLAVGAEAVVHDVQTNSISLFNVVEEISTQGFPLLVPRLARVFFLTRREEDPQRPECVIRVSQGRGLENTFPVNVDFERLFRTRVIVQLQGLVIQGTGTMRIALLMGDGKLGGWDIDVQQLEAPQPAVIQR